MTIIIIIIIIITTTTTLILRCEVLAAAHDHGARVGDELAHLGHGGELQPALLDVVCHGALLEGAGNTREDTQVEASELVEHHAVAVHHEVDDGLDDARDGRLDGRNRHVGRVGDVLLKVVFLDGRERQLAEFEHVRLTLSVRQLVGCTMHFDLSCTHNDFKFGFESETIDLI